MICVPLCSYSTTRIRPDQTHGPLGSLTSRRTLSGHRLVRSISTYMYGLCPLVWSDRVAKSVSPCSGIYKRHDQTRPVTKSARWNLGISPHLICRRQFRHCCSYNLVIFSPSNSSIVNVYQFRPSVCLSRAPSSGWCILRLWLKETPCWKSNPQVSMAVRPAEVAETGGAIPS